MITPRPSSRSRIASYGVFSAINATAAALCKVTSEILRRYLQSPKLQPTSVRYFIFAASLVILMNQFFSLYSKREYGETMRVAIDIVEYCAEVDAQAQRVLDISRGGLGTIPIIRPSFPTISVVSTARLHGLQMLAPFHYLLLTLKHGRSRVVEVIPQVDPLVVYCSFWSSEVKPSG
jgi:hypothetical protein